MSGAPHQARAVLSQWYGEHGRLASLLRWHRCVGFARHDGVGIDVDTPPGLLWARGAKDIDYLPGGPRTINGQPMTEDQAREVQRLLVQFSSDARDAWDGYSTLAVVMR